VEKLKDAVSKYVFISSVSAYNDLSKADFDERTGLARLTSEQAEKFAKIDQTGNFNVAESGDMYGALKVLCEEEVERVFPENNLIIRPGLIVGEYDFTDRFTYWVMRVAEGGEVLAPGDPDAFVQFIDAKDLTEWIVHLIERDETGIYNAVNKPFAITFENLLEEIKKISQSDAEFIWVSEKFMQENKVVPWSEMPLHLPAELENMRMANTDQAFAKGLINRPLKETIKDTLNWRKNVDQEMKAGIPAERERELLKKWKIGNW
jgi:2'-hydroxyisoflavone reductase